MMGEKNMIKNILIIANPGSGRGEAPKYAKELKNYLENTYQVDIRLKETEGLGDAHNWSYDAANQGYELVVCLGGDGTVSEVVSGIMKAENKPYFAFIPLGTVNDLARSVGYALEPRQAIEQFSHLTKTKVDVGQANDYFFVNVLALGSIPEAVLETESERKNRMGILAYITDGLRALLQGKPDSLIITNSKNQKFTINTNLLILALTSSVASLENLFPKAKNDDGLARLVAVKDSITNSILQTLFKEGKIPQQETNDEFMLVLKDSYFKIESPTSQHLTANIDGDEGPSLPLEIKIHQQSLPMLVPDKRINSTNQGIFRTKRR